MSRTGYSANPIRKADKLCNSRNKISECDVEISCLNWWQIQSRGKNKMYFSSISTVQYEQSFFANFL